MYSLKQELYKIDLQTRVKALNNQKISKTPFKSSTFTITFPSLESFQKFSKTSPMKQNQFLNLTSSQNGSSCLILGGFFEGIYLDFFQIEKLSKLVKNNLNLLVSLNKTLNLNETLKQKVIFFLYLCKARNGN